MKRAQLQIKQLTVNGQLLSCVNCFSGQVSVLRAAMPSAIRPYMNALAGIPGPEKFVLELDSETFLPYQHNLIGFGERFSSSEGTLENFLLAQGVTPGVIQSLLISFGLESCRSKSCDSLTRCEERRTRLLAAVHQPDKVIIVNDPFDPISSEWRERFAELLVSFARTKNQMVIVPYLSYRPECWIDNEFIARIQVGDNVQKTIGFGSNSANFQAMVNQIREEHNSGAIKNPPVKKPDTDPEKPTVQQVTLPVKKRASPQSLVTPDLTQQAENPYRLTTTPFQADRIAKLTQAQTLNRLAAVGLAFVLLFLFTSIQGRKNTETALVIDRPVPKQNLAVQNQPKVEELVSSAVVNIRQNEEKSRAESKAALPRRNDIQRALYSRYPDNIRDSIVRAVSSGRRPNLNRMPESREHKAEQQKKNQVASDFLKLLATTGSDKPDETNSSAYQEEYLPPSYIDRAPASDPSDEQARREQIRQKFLEAIQRAQERSG